MYLVVLSLSDFGGNYKLLYKAMDLIYWKDDLLHLNKYVMEKQNLICFGSCGCAQFNQSNHGFCINYAEYFMIKSSIKFLFPIG